jgi:hypothetical protein
METYPRAAVERAMKIQEVAAAQPGHAFCQLRRKNLDLIFSIQHERTVNQDNTVHISVCAAN